jgi:hypothetical protein
MALDVLYVPSQLILFVRFSHFGRNCLGNFPLEIRTLAGCHKLLAALRCLAGWVTTTFKEWLELKVLHPNAV